MELLKEKLLYLIREKYPDECFVLGEDTVEELTQECLDGWTRDDVQEAYQDTGGGFSFDLMATIALVFDALGAFKTALELIDRYEKRTEEQKTRYDVALEALLDNGIDIKTAEKYCERYYTL